MNLDKTILAMDNDLKINIRNDIKGWKDNCHQFDEDQVTAIQAAWFAERPLLVRGDPGLGKSQLAPALATYLNFDFQNIAVHSDTSIDELLYNIDHISRLCAAQIKDAKVPIEDYIEKGALWRLIAPNSKPENIKSAQQQSENKFDGSLLLIDEIDKADTSLPNALLEVLNEKAISIPTLNQKIEQQTDHQTFVVITSNDDKLLPPAFLRRCAILDLKLPSGEEGAKQLMQIYEAQNTLIKKKSMAPILEDKEVHNIALKLIKIRDKQIEANDYAPGTSEFLDLIKALNAYPKKERKVVKKHLFNALVDKRNQRA